MCQASAAVAIGTQQVGVRQRTQHGRAINKHTVVSSIKLTRSLCFKGLPPGPTRRRGVRRRTWPYTTTASTREAPVQRCTVAAALRAMVKDLGEVSPWHKTE